MNKIHLAMTAVATTLVAFATFADEAAKTETKAEAAKTETKAEAAKTEAKTEAKKETAKKESSSKYKPLAEARAKIGDVIADPALITDLLKGLSPEDQKTFLADVNAAIAKLPGSTEDKTAKYLNVNRAALKGVPAESITAMIAVTFATVPPESLAVISERYAVDLFNRDADPSQKVADAAYEKVAMEVVGSVEKETTGSDDAGVRNTLAIIMFVRGANGTMPELTDKLVATMPDVVTRDLAKREWIPAALQEGSDKSYESMLAYADAGRLPNIDIVINLAGPQILEAMTVDIMSAMDNAAGIQQTPVLDQALGGFDEARVHKWDDTTSASSWGSARPNTSDRTKQWANMYKRDNLPPKKQQDVPTYHYTTM